MNPMIKKILLDVKSDRIKILNELEGDISLARKILNGKYSYCSKCDDFYLSKSFIEETNVREEDVCIFADPINSSGDEYVRKKVTYNLLICPKGHEQVINRSY